MLTLLFVLLAFAFIIVAIIKFEIHPFLALFVGAIFYGLIAGMPAELIVQSISDGFGGVLGSIGLLILFGVIIGTFLEKTGGAFVIAQKILAWIGEKSVTLAMMVTGYILSIPVFGDSTFIMLNPISKSLSFKGKIPYAATTIAITLGVTASHSLVPPTPGPIAAAGILEADLGMVIMWGFIVSSLALVPCFFFAKYYASRIDLVPEFAEEERTTEVKKYPSLVKCFLPIAVPLLLIVLASIANYPTRPFGENTFTYILSFLGSPVIALLLGTFLSFVLPAKFDKKLLSSSGWFGEALLIAAPVILITGAGGVFGKMLQNSGLGDMVSGIIEPGNLSLLLPFLLAFALKSAQGSSTVALVTTASIVAPLLGTLGLDSEMSKVFTVLAIGAGATAISHANDSFFWAMTQLTGMNVKQGYMSHSIGTLIMAFTAISLIFIISSFF
ncbi:GntP family gluconate:H+ symporter [Catalinimonas alkaloidigena]|uniref:GntP family permease n=1 Tax=Catalinimonas alkaloidigena TaxID=1075417 RepID=UPI0024067CE5|nr:GntP family permease [Catalinimonas alkaloidigena]MDF9794879.1 GntP family gluconate:H+ symporter [Catalinimonas alkaloidigena]